MVSSWSRISRAAYAAVALAVVGLGAQPALAQLPADPLIAQKLPARGTAHWVWLNDFAFPHLTDGRAYLIDADQGRMLGVLSTGFSFVSVLVPRTGSVIYSPETYFSRGTRGTRTDVVTLYDAGTLVPVGEIVIPPKRASALPMHALQALTDDDRFLLIYNFTPAQSTTVVDTRARKLVGELDTAGCSLVYPTGPRTFFSICGDGGLLSVTLNDAGKISHQAHGAPLFDMQKDPLTEKAVRRGDTWYFVSYDGDVYPIRTSGAQQVLDTRWSLTTPEERADAWRPGGLQQLAIHGASGRLFAIMHQGPRETHKDPGKEVWVFDVKTHARVQRFSMKNDVSSIEVSQDDHPLLYSAFMGSSAFDIYDATNGEYLRSVDDVGATPGLIVAP
ncbi:MAG TPA: amine dehydrogenase large subunit [Steroidobacteraceae bacterium]|jgi:methylamine dehydrogenase heavy chain|nr:amine dehydrogenase large subunit [Steroidobacteraceae bacterium]